MTGADGVLVSLDSLPATIASAFLVTLVTVIVPSPSTITASRLSMTRGTRAAAAFLSGVVVLEVIAFFIMAVGMQPLLQRLGGASVVTPLAGVLMVVGGVVMAVTAPQAARRVEERSRKGAPARGSLHGPFLGGLLVPSANPGFWLWWSTVGTSFIHAARQWGDLGLTLLLAAFLAGVAAWYLPLLVALRRGKNVFSPHVLRWLLVGLGCGLVVIGLRLVWVGSIGAH